MYFSTDVEIDLYVTSNLHDTMNTQDYNKLYDLIGERRKHWDSVRKGPAHILCPKVNDEDSTNYQNHDDEHVDLPDTDGSLFIKSDEKKRRIAEADARITTTTEYSMVVGLDEQTAGPWIPEFRSTLDTALTKCDRCIRNWHLHRVTLLAQLRKDYVDQVAEIMAARYDAIDSARITSGLQVIESIIDQAPTNTTITPSQIIRSHGGTVLLPLLESLCSLRYLSAPDHRQIFNKVFLRLQAKRVLKLGNAGVLPAMTRFLFEGDPIRPKFARAGWASIPDVGMTSLEWDWAVSEELNAQIKALNLPFTPEKMPAIERFWDGFLVMANALPKDIIESKLVSTQPLGPGARKDIYHLAMDHLGSDSACILSLIFQVFAILLEKAPAGFWRVFQSYARQGVAQSFLTARCFPHLLLQGSIDQHTGIPVAICWVVPLMTSQDAPTQRAQVGEKIVEILLKELPNDPQLRVSHRAVLTAARAAIDTLKLMISPYLNPEYKINPGSLMQINVLIRQVLDVAHATMHFVTLSPSENTFGIKMREPALQLTGSILELDGLAYSFEWRALQLGNITGIQTVRQRPSAQLWQALLAEVKPGNHELASVVLFSSRRFLQIHPLIPPKANRLKDLESSWNTTMQETASEVARGIERLCDYDSAHCSRFLESEACMAATIQALFNSNQDLNAAALQFIKQATDEDARDDAVRKLLLSKMTQFLDACSDGVEYWMGDNLCWGPVPHILNLSQSIFSALCDPADGILRAKPLNSSERQAVLRWWSVQWLYVHKSLQQTEGWSKKYAIEKRVLSEFVRDAMQFSNGMLKEDGVFATAITPPDRSDLHQTNMSRLLVSVQKCIGLTQMIRLRDRWLIEKIVEILTKLLKRLRQCNMKPHPEMDKLIRNTCLVGPGGRYTTPTNLEDIERAQLVEALGIQAPEDDDVVVTNVKKLPETKIKMRLDLSSQARLPEDEFKKLEHDLTPTMSKTSKGNSVLEQMMAKQHEFARLKRLKEEKLAQVAAETKAQQEAKQASIREKRRKEKEESDKAKKAMIERAKALRQPKPTVPGEGSGLRAIGAVRGKTHMPAAGPKSEIMVNSDSEEDDDDDEGLDEFLKGSKKPHMNESERMLALRATAGPVKKQRIIRDEKSNRARIAPSMDRLHAALLDWDIFHLGDDPPNQNECVRVEPNYYSPANYKNTFFPLLIHEAWRAFVTAKAESTQKPFNFKVTTRISVDSFIEIGTAIPVSEANERFLSEGDIILFSQSNDPLHDEQAEHLLARIKDTKVKQRNMDITFRVNRDPKSSLKPGRINPGLELSGVKITNMITIEREFAALESLQFIDLCQEVISAQPSPTLKFTDDKVDATMGNWQLNRGQATAVLNASANDGFTLIQGPPGTGKTKTIVAMVGSLLEDMPNLTVGSAISRPHGFGRGPVAPQPPKKKLLVCAPSNAAVDEIVLRLKGGVRTSAGKDIAISVLRLGRTDVMSAAVKDVSLEELVKQRMEGENNIANALKEKDELHKRAGELKSKVTELRPQLESARASGDREGEVRLQRQYDMLKSEQSKVGRQIDEIKSKDSTRQRDNKIRRTQIEQELLDKAHVVCATLSGSGHHMFRDLKGIDFETVIIDEAAQCVELSALIPLKYGCIKCILVGDPKQLPPTVLSQSAQKYGYDQSLFVRMQQNRADAVHLLDCQYRMHPEISRFPSRTFYDDRLKDGLDMWENRTRSWHGSLYLGPYRFFDVEGSHESHRGGSLINRAELEAAMALFNRFQCDYGNQLDGKIGVITPYKAQLHFLRDSFARQFGPSIVDRIEFNTTDAFQGRECEIIIFSCVRADPTGGIGFMKDIRRMNVGLTRAKSSLWVLGNSQTLEKGIYWKKLIEDARSRNLYTTGNIVGLLGAPGPAVDPRAKKPKVDNDLTTTIADEIPMADTPLDLAAVAPRLHDHDIHARMPDVNKAVQLTPDPKAITQPNSNSFNSKQSCDVPIRSSGMPNEPASLKVSSQHGQRVSNPGSNDSRKRSYAGPDGYPSKRNPSHHYQDKDPSAEQTLGLAPPDRPPATSCPAPNNAPRSGSILPGKPRVPSNKGGASPFIPKKPRRPPPQK